MIIKLLKSYKPLILLLIPIIIVIFWFGLLRDQNIEFYTKNSTPIFSYIQSLFTNNLIIPVIISILIIAFQAFFINKINTKHILTEGRTHSLPIIYVLLASSINYSFKIHPIIIASPFLLVAVDQLLKTYKLKNAISKIFLSGFLLGIGSLFYFDILYLLIPFWIGLSILRSFNFREWMTINIGFIVPYIFSFIYFFFNDNSYLYLNSLYASFQVETQLIMELTWKNYALFSTIILITIATIIHYTKENYGYKISSIKYFNVLLWIFLFCTLILIAKQDIMVLTIMIIPLSFLVLNYGVAKKYSLVKEIFLIVILIVLVGINIVGYFGL